MVSYQPLMSHYLKVSLTCFHLRFCAMYDYSCRSLTHSAIAFRACLGGVCRLQGSSKSTVWPKKYGWYRIFYLILVPTQASTISFSIHKLCVQVTRYFNGVIYQTYYFPYRFIKYQTFFLNRGTHIKLCHDKI